MYSSTDSFADVAKELDAAVSWLEDLGVPIPGGARHGEYRRIVLGLADAYSNERISEFLDANGGLETVLNASLEAAELRRIHRSLSEPDDPDLLSMLKHFVKGPTDHRAESPDSSSNRARNFAFELSLGAHLRGAGVDVDFGSKADLRVQLADHLLYVECKRPQKHSQVNSRIKEALKQLSLRFEAHDGPLHPLGVVAVSVTKLVNPESLVLRAPTQEVANQGFDQHLKSFINTYESKWKHPRDPRVIGALLEISGIAQLEHPNLYVTSSYVGIASPNRRGTVGHHVLRDLYKRL